MAGLGEEVGWLIVWGTQEGRRFDMDGTLTVSVVYLHYMRQMGGLHTCCLFRERAKCGRSWRSSETVAGIMGHTSLPPCLCVDCAQRVGVGATGDILDIIKSWPAEEQQRAHAAIEEIEDQALKDMQVGDRHKRCAELMGWQGVSRSGCMQPLQR